MHSIKDKLYSLKNKADHHQPQAPINVPSENDGSASDSEKDIVTPVAEVVQQHSDPALLAITQHSIDVFLASAQPNGEIGGIGYWQTANGYTAIALHEQWSHPKQRQQNMNYLCRALDSVRSHHRDFINEFNDDTLWWGNCLLDVYSLSPNPEYLEIATRLHAHVSRSVLAEGKHSVNGQDMKGGVMWTTRPGEDQVNSITTGLYAEVSARLSLLAHEAQRKKHLLSQAQSSLDWILRCRYRRTEALVLDTIKLKTRECVDWTFTYTTGQAMAACTAIHHALSSLDHCSPHNDDVLEHACAMARKSMIRPGWVDASSGILTEAGTYSRANHEAWRNDDAVGFKSVLLRSLARLYDCLSTREHYQQEEDDLRDRIKEFVETQFRAQQERNTNARGQYGPWWDGPMDLPTSHSQMAVLDVMAAVQLVRRR
ncbi:hypothetical protein AAFC00_006277 [Neodothiora populina]|uniref:Uncharacterized protein n=1 Tax=Neodothiora populina TaxID=2781224 RepID=A0ABR3P4Z5_9PEZI